MAIRIEKSGPVWTIIHSRIGARNAMDPESADAIHDAFQEFEAADDASVAVLWGEGGAFCAGWDLKFASNLTTRDAFEQEVTEKLAFPMGAAPGPRGPMGPTRMELSKPVIAAIEGPAVAGGMEIALWCDCRIMTDQSYFGVYCRRWGVTLVDGGTVRLPRIVGQGRALDIIMTGRKVDAEESLRIGLCERVVPVGMARQEAEAMAHEISRFPQGAMRADRRSVYEASGRSIREGMRTEWHNGVEQILKEGVRGATKFSSGLGRGGDFEEI